MDWTSIGTVVSAVVASVMGSQLLTAWVQGRQAKRKTDADASVSLANTMLQWQNDLMKRINSLEQEVAKCHAEHSVKDEVISELKLRISRLESELQISEAKVCQHS